MSNTNGKTEAKNTFSANYQTICWLTKHQLNNFNHLLSYEFHICVNNCFSTHEQVIFVNKRFIRHSGMFLWLRANKFTLHVNWFVQLDKSLGLTQRANKTTNGILVYEFQNYIGETRENSFADETWYQLTRVHGWKARDILKGFQVQNRSFKNK